MRDNVIDDYHMRCTDCKKIVEVVDFYARNRFKRCPDCQAKYRKAYLAIKAAERRRQAREHRTEKAKEVTLLRTKNRLLEQEVRELKFVTRALSEQVDEICNPDPVTDINDMIERKRKKDLT